MIWDVQHSMAIIQNNQNNTTPIYRSHSPPSYSMPTRFPPIHSKQYYMLSLHIVIARVLSLALWRLVSCVTLMGLIALERLVSCAGRLLVQSDVLRKPGPITQTIPLPSNMSLMSEVICSTTSTQSCSNLL